MLDSISKDRYGPLFALHPRGTTTQTKVSAVVHRFSDQFSVLDWGKMPETLTDRGISQSLIHHHLSTLLSSPSAWKDYLRSPDALTFRKAASSIPQNVDAHPSGMKTESIGSMLNEMGSEFPLASNYLGILTEGAFKNLNPQDAVSPEVALQSFAELRAGIKTPVLGYGIFELFSEEKIPFGSVMGKAVWDYPIWKKSNGIPSVLPIEFKCHFELRAEAIPNLKSESLVIPKTASLATLVPSSTWDFPLIEMVLDQDPFHHRIGFNELLWITGFSVSQIQKTVLTAAWIASFLRWALSKSKLTLVEANIRFAVEPSGKLILISHQTLDELRLDFEGKSLHTDTALEYFQKTSWYESVLHAQKIARAQGLTDWKRLCVETAPLLESQLKKSLEKIAPSVAHHLTGIPLMKESGAPCFSELKLL